MLDVGFFEIVMVCVVALLVLGPDKLPGTIRTVGLWIGRLKRSFNNIRTEIEKEVGADEIRRQLRNEEIMEKIKSTQKQFTSTVDSVKKEAAAVTDSLKPEGMDELKKDFDSVTGKSSSKTEDNSQNKESSGTEEKVAEKKETAAPAPEASRPASSEPPSEKPEPKADSQG